MKRVLTDEQKSAKRASNAVYRERNRQVINERQRVSAAKYRASDLYRTNRARPEVRERIRLQKEQKRREMGVVPRDGLSRQREEMKAQARRQARMDFKSNFIGPPTPKRSMTAAHYYTWSMRNDPEFYARELDRAQRYKARTRPGYRDSIVPWAATPSALKQVKHLQYLIGREIYRRSENENNQPTA